MGLVYETTWEMDGYFADLPALFQPRAFAAGYSLDFSDTGKQVYIRSEYALELRTKPKAKFQGSFVEHLRASLTLTVSYVVTPKRTSVSFLWESPLDYYPYGGGTRSSVVNSLVAEAKQFYQYLNEWVAAAEQKELEKE